MSHQGPPESGVIAIRFCRRSERDIGERTLSARLERLRGETHVADGFIKQFVPGGGQDDVVKLFVNPYPAVVELVVQVRLSAFLQMSREASPLKHKLLKSDQFRIVDMFGGLARGMAR